jgi:hypothetical protein
VLDMTGDAPGGIGMKRRVTALQQVYILGVAAQTLAVSHALEWYVTSLAILT